MRRLRKAFEDQGYDLPISTVRGLGYRLDKIDIAEEVEKLYKAVSRRQYRA